MFAYKRHGPIQVVAYVLIYYAGGYIQGRECEDIGCQDHATLHVVGVFKLLVPCSVILCE